MGQPIAVRTDFTALEVRRLARRAKDSDQVRRLLAVAAVLEVVSRIFRTFIMRRLRFQIAAVDRVAAYSCSIWPTTLFRRCAVVALPPG